MSDKQNDDSNSNVIDNLKKIINDNLCRTFPSKSIGISIQVSENRLDSRDVSKAPDSCKLCQEKTHDPIECEYSEIIMKHLYKMLYTKELSSNDYKAINDIPIYEYRCHCRLNNIVVPYYDDIITKVAWFIFIGQCVIVGGTNDHSKELRERYNIKQLNKADINIVTNTYELDRKYINSGCFSKDGEGENENHVITIKESIISILVARSTIRTYLYALRNANTNTDEFAHYSEDLMELVRKANNSKNCTGDSIPFRANCKAGNRHGEI